MGGIQMVSYNFADYLGRIKNQVIILTILMKKPTQKYTAVQLVNEFKTDENKKLFKKLQIPTSTIYAMLQGLRDDGILKDEKISKFNFFYLNPEHIEYIKGLLKIYSPWLELLSNERVKKSEEKAEKSRRYRDVI